MLEKYVASLLVPYLNKYVENIDAAQLRIDIWSGKASLKDLILRPEAIDALLDLPDNSGEAEKPTATTPSASPPIDDEESKTGRIPVRMTRGVCKNAQLYIPLKRLRSEPVVLEIDEVLVTLQSLEDAQRLASSLSKSPNTHGENATTADAAALHKGIKWDYVAARKQRELDSFEAERRRQREAAAAANAGAEEALAEARTEGAAAAQSKTPGYFARLAELVVNNMVVKIRSVHIRYEDRAHRTVLGAIVGDVQLLTVNEATGAATFTDPSSLKKMCKRLVLSGLQLYCDAPSEIDAKEKQGRCWLTALQSADDWQEWYHLMRKRVRDGDLALSTIFGPVSGAVDVKLVFKSFMKSLLQTPYATVHVKMEHVLARLSRDQYTTLVRTVSRLIHPGKTPRVVRDARRPQVPVKGHARAWWQYVLQVVHQMVRAPRQARLLARISDVCKMDYQVLYRDVVRQTDMSAEKKRTYRFITRFMTVPDMIAGRRDVYGQLALEMQRKRKDNQTKKADAPAGGVVASQTEGTATTAASAPAAPVSLPAPPKKSGWFSWFRGSGGATNMADGTTNTTASAKTAEQEEEEIFRNLALDYGITAEEAAESENGAVTTSAAAGSSSVPQDGQPEGRDPSLPARYTWLDLIIDLPYAKYAIDMGKGGSTALQLFHFHTRVQRFNYASSALLHVWVQNICLSNSASPDQSEGAALVRQLIEGVQTGHTDSLRTPQVVSLVNAPDTAADASGRGGGAVPTLSTPTLREILGLDGTSSQGSSGSSLPLNSPRGRGGEAVPLLDIAAAYQPIEQPVADTKLDVALRVQLLPLRIVMDPHTIEYVNRFFELPAGVDVSSLTASTMEAASAVGSKASQELKFAMGKAKGIYVSVDVSAPILVLPTTLRGRRTETALAMALGRVRFTSAPLSETEKQRRLKTGGDAEEALYYTSRARFGRFYVELTTLEDALLRPEKGFMLVPEVSIVADVLQRIDERQTNRDRVVVRLKVPALRVGLSLHQVYRLTHLVETWLRYTSPSSFSAAGATAGVYGDRYGGGGEGLGNNSLLAAGGLHRLSRSDSLDNSSSPGESPRASHSSRVIATGTAGASAGSPFTGNGSLITSSALPAGGAASQQPQRSASPLFAMTEEPAHDGARRPSTSTHTQRGTSTAASGAGGVNAGAASTSTCGGVLSPYAVSLPPPQDLPVFRLELLVKSLGVDLYEDDTQTLAVVTSNRFAITCVDAELIFAKRTLKSKLVLVMQETLAMDTTDPDAPILHSAGLRVDVGLSSGGPVAVGLLLDNAALTLRIGTPCMELLECVMDMVNLVMSTVDTISAIGKAPSPCPSAYGVGAAPLARVASSSLVAEDLRYYSHSNAHSGHGLASSWRQSQPMTTNATAVPALSGYVMGNNASTSSAALGGGHIGSGASAAGSGGAAASASGSGGAAASPRSDARVANISIRIDGESRLEMMSRHRGDHADYLFASATVCDVDIFLKKNRNTMELAGKVGSAEANMSERSELLPSHRRIIRRGNQGVPHVRTASHMEAASEGTGSTTPYQPSTPMRCDTQRPSALDVTQEMRDIPSSNVNDKRPAPQLRFTYRKNEPVAPVFGVEDGKRVLQNATELRYSSALELELGASTLCVDLRTIMLLKAYFTTGFFSRITRLTDRPLYNCRTLPPAREAPQLLMSIRVVVTDAVIELPIDARANATEYFGASIGHVTVQNNLLSSEGQQSTTVSLREICLWRYGDRCTRHGLLPSPTFIEVAVRTDLDVDSEEPTRLDIRSDDMSATINSADLVDLATLLRQNLSRTDVDEIDSAPAEEPTVRQYVGSPHTLAAPASGASGTEGAALGNPEVTRTDAENGPSAGLHISLVPPPADDVSLGNTSAAAHAETMVGLRVTKLAVVLEEEPGQPLFRLGAASIAMIASTPSNQLNLLWKSLEVADLRPAGSPDAARASSSGATNGVDSEGPSRASSSYTSPATTLLLCGEGHVQFAHSLTTRSILMSDFGVRPRALTSVDTEAMNSLTSSEAMTTLGGGVSRSRAKPRGASLLTTTTAPGAAGTRYGRHHGTKTAARGGGGGGAGVDTDDDSAENREADEVSGENADAYEEPMDTLLGSSSPASPTELLTVAVLSINFSLRRFAISDQWLSVYDLVCNEEVVNAFTAPQTGAVVPLTMSAATSSASTPAGTYHPPSAGFRCTVSTSSVAIPFLTSDRRVLCEARLESLLVDVVSLGSGSHVTVKVQALELIDAKSGERILRKRKGALTSGLTSMSGEEGTMDFGEVESPLAAEYGSGYATYATTSVGVGSPTLPMTGNTNTNHWSGSPMVFLSGPAASAPSPGTTTVPAPSGAATAQSGACAVTPPTVLPSVIDSAAAPTSSTGGFSAGGPLLLPLSAQLSGNNNSTNTNSNLHSAGAVQLGSPPPPATRIPSTAPLHASAMDNSNAQGGTGASSHPTAASSTGVTSGDVLYFSFRGDGEAHKNRIQLQIGQLDVLLSMPIMYGLLEYFTHPDQPIAKISSLGVMKEQRARVAAAAQNMAKSSVISLHVLWHQPRLLCVVDGMDLSKWSMSGRNRALQVCLGVMRTSVLINQALEHIAVTLRAQDFSIDEALEKASLRMGFSAVGPSTQEITVELDKTVGLFHPAEIEHVIVVMRRNLLVPRTQRYYDFVPLATDSTVSSSPTTITASGTTKPTTSPVTARVAIPTKAGDAAAPTAGPTADAASVPHVPTARTVTVSIRGLHVAMHDLMRMHTHTLTLADLSLTMCDEGDLDLVVPLIFLQEHFTNRYLLYSGRPTSAAAPTPATLASTTATTTVTTTGSSSGSGGGGGAPSDDKNALVVRMCKDRATGASLTDVAVSNATVTLVPRGVGSLINVLLSLTIPEDPYAASTVTATTATTATSTTNRREDGRHVRTSGLTAHLDACGVRFPVGDEDIAMLHLEVVHCEKDVYADGSSDLRLVLGRLVMEDLMSRRTLYKNIIEPFADESASEVDERLDTARVNSAEAAAEVAQKNFVDLSVKTVAKVRYASATAPLYGTQVTCRVGHLCFTCVPDVVRSLVSVASEVTCNMSENNRGRAIGYVSDTANAGLEAVRRTMNTANTTTAAPTTPGAASDAPPEDVAAQNFVKLDITVQRPQFRLVSSAMSLDSVEVYPGTLCIQTELLPAGSQARTTRLTDPAKANTTDDLDEPETLDTLQALLSDFAPRQAFRLSVHRMNVTVLSEPVFKERCRLDVQLLQGTNAARDLPQSHLDVTAPVVAMRLSEPQLGLFLDVVGNYVGEGSAAAKAQQDNASHNASFHPTGSPVGRGDGLSTAFGSGNSLATMGSVGGAAPPGTGGAHGPLNASASSSAHSTSASSRHRAGGGAGPANTAVPTLVTYPPSTSGTRSPSMGAIFQSASGRGGVAAAATRAPAPAATSSTPTTPSLFSLCVEMARMEMDISDVFRWTLQHISVQSQSSPPPTVQQASKNGDHEGTDSADSAGGSYLAMTLEALSLQHAGAQVLALAQNPSAVTAETASSALDDVHDIVVIRRLRLDSRTTTRSASTASTDLDNNPNTPTEPAAMTETEVTVETDVLSLAISPSSLFDARELLYLPFSSKVLHIPVDPIPVLFLTEAVTRLDRDIILDDKHVLLTGNRMRCCYELDLQRHRLVLTGPPSAQIVLYEGCELTITNGTIVLPGLYTLGSFTSFAAQSALHTTSSCLIEKQAHGGAASAANGRPPLTQTQPASALTSNRSPVNARIPPPLHARGATAAAGEELAVPPPSRTLVSFHAALARISLISDDVVDLSTSLESEMVVKLGMDVKEGKTTARSIGIQFKQTVSGDHEPHVVLPTNMAIDISGTDRLVVSVLLDSLECCARAALLASVLETIKDLGTAFLEEMTVARVKPTVQLEDASNNVLHAVTEAGDCVMCERKANAYFGKAGDTRGTMCYECCTGLASLPSMDVRVEVPLVDAILIGARGDMLHLDARRLIVNLDANMDVRFGLQASLYTMNNAAAVWEPCVEQLIVSMTGNVATNDYKFLVGRLRYVVSPINVTQLSAVLRELSTPVLRQKNAHKAFRRLAATKAPGKSYKGTRMYQAEVDETFEEARASDATRSAQKLSTGSEKDRDDNEELLSTVTLDANMSVVNNFSMTARVAQRRGLNVFDLAQGFHRGRAERLPPLLTPGKRSATAEAIKAAQDAVRALTSNDTHPFAYVFVTNHLHSAILFEDKRIESRGGTARIMTSHTTALVRSASALATAAHGSVVTTRTEEEAQGYVIDLANPLLYAQGPGFFLETVVSIRRDAKDSHRLRRVVHVRAFPLHPTGTIICVENLMSFPLDVRSSKAAMAHSVNQDDPAQAFKRPMTIKTGERFFFDPQMTFDTPLMVEPNTAGSDADTADESETTDVRLPPAEFHASGAPLLPSTVLSGTPVLLSWSATRKISGGSGRNANPFTISASVSARQEAIRGGVPVYALTVAPRFHLINKLPHPVSLSLVEASSTSRTVTSTSKQAVEVGARSRAGLTRLLLNHHLTTLDGARFTLSVFQLTSSHAKTDVYTTQTPFVADGFADAGAASRRSDSEANADRSATTCFLTLLSADRNRQLVVRLVISGPRLVLTTPFLLVNHTPLQLQLVECEPNGELKKRTGERSRGTSLNLTEETNYSVLPANMDTGLIACPAAPTKEGFFVNVQTGVFQAKSVPLHVQQRGIILLEEVVALSSSNEVAVSRKKPKSTKSRTGGGGDARADTSARRMLHLAYASHLDETGAIRVTITPRWVVLNRCRFPLVVAAAAYAGVNAQDAAAAATAAVAVAHADSVVGSAASTPTTHQDQVDDFKQALLRADAEQDVDRRELPTSTTPHTIAPRSAMPLFETPHCPPETGFHLHVLQDVDAPLHGTPVALETIHSEVVLAYNHCRNNPKCGSGARNDGGGAVGRNRDRFVDVSLIARDPYTYVVLQEPETPPFLFLNRTPYYVDVIDTAPRSQGRLLARTAPGTGSELLLDPSVTTTAQVLARQGVAGEVRLSAVFDFGRNMTTRERSAAQTAGKLHYTINYGAYGHCDVELRVGDVPTAKNRSSATADGAKASVSALTASTRVHVQEPPSALSVLLNLSALTISVLMPNQDVLLASVLDTRVRWARSGEREMTTFSVRNFQVDNQTEIDPRYDACALALRKTATATALSGYVERVLVPAKRLLCFNEVKIDCAPVALRVSDLLLARLLRFSELLGAERALQEESLIASSVEAASGSASTIIRIPDNRTLMSARERQDLAALRHPSNADLYRSAPLEADFLTTRLMIERFIVNPLLIRFWLTRDVEEHDFFRENIHSREAALLSMMVASCEDVQIAAPGLACVKRVSRLGVFLQWIVKCYTDGLVAQLHGVVMQYASSLPLLGAPVKLFSGIGGGAVRLFKDPIEGLATSPSAFLAGLGSGSTGFVKGIFGGGLGAFSNLTDAGSRLLSASSGASERERQHQNTLTAFARGLQGIYQKPMEGHAEAGTAGFFKGAVQGLVGVVTNPVSGMLSDVSKATGTFSRLVNDTYVPKTQRVRDIRMFHANGGVAPWDTVMTVFQYERLDQRKQQWSGSALLSHSDGPEWYPCPRDRVTVEGVPVPDTHWALDRYGATVDGWTFGSRYYSSYTSTLTASVRTRRKSWTALVKTLPYSAVATYLRVNPGMATTPPAKKHNRSASADFAAGMCATTVVTFAPPGVLTACTVQEARSATLRSQQQHKRRYRRTFESGFRTTRTRSCEFFDKEEFEDSKGVCARMRRLTSAGRHMGVRPEALRRTPARLDDDDDLPQQRLVASDFQQPDEPAESKKRRGRTPKRVMFVSSEEGRRVAQADDDEELLTTAGADGAAGTAGASSSRSGSRTRSTPKHRRSDSRGDRFSTPAEPLSSEQRQAARGTAVTTVRQTAPPPLIAYEERPATRRDTQKPSSSHTPSATKSGAIAAPSSVRPVFSPTHGSESGVTMAVSPLRPVPKPSRDVVTVYEYERKVTLFGWGRRLMDCPVWQNASGRETASRDEQQPPPGWSWASEWTIVGGDPKDGWETPVNGDRNMRRRCWQRVMIQK